MNGFIYFTKVLIKELNNISFHKRLGIIVKAEEYIKILANENYIIVYYETYSFSYSVFYGSSNGQEVQLSKFLKEGFGFDWVDNYVAAEKLNIVKVANEITKVIHDFGFDIFFIDASRNIEILNLILKDRSLSEQVYQNNMIEKKAKVAWDKQDYEQVIKLYTSMEDNLSDIQLKRKKLSEKYIKKNSKNQ